MNQTFSLGQVLSITTGRLCCDQWEPKHPMAELAEEMGEDRMKARCVVVAPKESTEPTAP